ncbi:MAG: hypothetical protein ACREHD_29095 [Pirellulales bacterium]
MTNKAVLSDHYVDTEVDLDRPTAIEGQPVFEHPLHPEQLDETGRPYRRAVFAYRVYFEDEAGTESGRSPAVFSVPSSPQYVFSRENGTTCELKWAPNAEKGITGYRVYRMDGRFDKEPVSRLTVNPLPDTTFQDETAGKQARRYYVIAVDALGQEGLPSSPVWFQRERRDYYLPFVGDWHQ